MMVSELVNRIGSYARHINAPLQSHTEVLRVSATGSGFCVEMNQGPIQCKTLVMATGACANPHVPALSAAIPNDVLQITSSDYKRPGDLPERDVLGVGSSATGVQLAREINAAGHPVTLAASWHTRLPRTYRGRDVEWWLDAIGALDERHDEVDDLARARRTPSPQLIGGPDPVDLNALQERGVEVVGRLMDIRDGVALFSGGLANACASVDLKMHRLLDRVDEWVGEQGLDDEVLRSDRPAATRVSAKPSLNRSLTDGGIRSIVWATGDRPDFSWLDIPVFDTRGRLKHYGGMVAAP